MFWKLTAECVCVALVTDYADYSHCLLTCWHHAPAYILQSINTSAEPSVFSTVWAQIRQKEQWPPAPLLRFLGSFPFICQALLPLKVASTNLLISSPGTGLIFMIWDVSLIRGFNGDKVIASQNYFLLQCQCPLGRRQGTLESWSLMCIGPFHLQT